MDTARSHSIENPDDFDERDFRTALGRFGSGITVVTTCTPTGEREGLTVNAFSALSLHPPMILWCIRNTAPSRRAFEQSEYFGINVLSASQRHLSVQFATPREDKFIGVECDKGLAGIPLIAGALARFECRQHSRHQGGDHVIFFGRVERFSYQDGEPLLFSSGRYAIPAPHPEDAGRPADATEFADLLL